MSDADIEDCGNYIFSRDKCSLAGTNTSFIDIPGQISLAIFFAGCPIKCKDCQNKELWDIKEGKITHICEILEKINKHELTKWVCFLGGEPFYQNTFLENVCSNIKKNIGIYSGYTFRTLIKNHKSILDIPNVKFLVSGPFVKSKYVEGRFPASTNQEVRIKIDNKWIIIKKDITDKIRKL